MLVPNCFRCHRPIMDGEYSQESQGARHLNACPVKTLPVPCAECSFVGNLHECGLCEANCCTCAPSAMNFEDEYYRMRRVAVVYAQNYFRSLPDHDALHPMSEAQAAKQVMDDAAQWGKPAIAAEMD